MILTDDQLPVPLAVLRAIGNAALRHRDDNDGRWDATCIAITEAAEAILDEQGIGYFSYACNPDELWGGVRHDWSHHYVILHNGWIVDASIRQYIDGQYTATDPEHEQRRAAEGYPYHPDAPHVAVIPPWHPFVEQMGYESHMGGYGFCEYQPFVRVPRDEWDRHNEAVIRPWLRENGLDE